VLRAVLGAADEAGVEAEALEPAFLLVADDVECAGARSVGQSGVAGAEALVLIAAGARVGRA
jgi:hypothetical protein